MFSRMAILLLLSSVSLAMNNFHERENAATLQNTVPYAQFSLYANNDCTGALLQTGTYYNGVCYAIGPTSSEKLALSLSSESIISSTMSEWSTSTTCSGSHDQTKHSAYTVGCNGIGFFASTPASPSWPTFAARYTM